MESYSEYLTALVIDDPGLEFRYMVGRPHLITYTSCIFLDKEAKYKGCCLII